MIDLGTAIHGTNREAMFEYLRAEGKTLLVFGRDQGSNVHLEASIGVAEVSLTFAKTADERGTAFNDLGISLGTLGERESDTTRLESAVTAFQEALKEYTRERVPLGWARTQNNLSTCLALIEQHRNAS